MGDKILQFLFGLQLPLTRKPWITFSNPCNKVRGTYFVKEVFLRLSLLLCCYDYEHTTHAKAHFGRLWSGGASRVRSVLSLAALVEATWRRYRRGPAFTSRGRDWHTPRVSGVAVHPGSNPLRRSKVYGLAPEVPFFRRMLMGPEVFWGMQNVSGLRPYALTYLKKALYHNRAFGWELDKYHHTRTWIPIKQV